ncbi:MAG: hypothetical protein A2V86_13030 [Deltaproteobacteria bacterium RBG_16_49_23]|nr:MAG: hypothetical protein A2V86_13030 [Deltaproteobacteria bacterium RBG_16_49_23]
MTRKVEIEEFQDNRHNALSFLNRKFCREWCPNIFVRSFILRNLFAIDPISKGLRGGSNFNLVPANGRIKQEIANTYSSSSHIQACSWVRDFIREGKEITDVVNTSHLLDDKLRFNCFWKNSLSILFNKGPYFGWTVNILFSCFFP